MKKIMYSLSFMLIFAMLAGCAGDPASKGTSVQEPPNSAESNDPAGVHPPETIACLIVDGAAEGNLILADLNGPGIYRLNTADLEIYEGRTKLTPADLKDGMAISISYNTILETWPAQFHHVTLLDVLDQPIYDYCGLYFQVLEDLWGTDSGLNGDITYLGFDLSELTDLSAGEKSALIWRFSELHGATPLTGTYEELVQQGYINGSKLYWEDGLLLTLKGSAAEGFSATKWRDGTGAYFFFDCTAKQDKDGTWSYKIGGQAIS